MPLDAEQIKSRIESRLAEGGIDLRTFGPSLAMDIGQRISSLANQLKDIAVAEASAIADEAAREVEAAAAEAVVAAEASAASAAHAPPPRADGDEARENYARIRRAVDAIEAGKTQVDILKALLGGTADFCTRAALFIVKGDKGIGWLAHGFGSTPPFTDDGIKKVSVPLGADTFFRNVFGAGNTYHGPGENSGDNGRFFERIGGFVPRELLAVPLVIKGKVVAILYGDGGSEIAEIAAPDVVATLVQVAAMSIKLIPIKTRPEESGESSGRFMPQTESGSFRRSTSDSGSYRPATDTGAQQRPVAPPTPTPRPTPPPEPAAETTPPPQKRPAPSAEPTDAIPAEDKKLHDDARRFARLLVSEIKLYNEAKVAVGKRNKDLYERLKEDIERSRQMYNERFPAKITSTTNYFFEELVNQLADGDRAALGI